MHVDSLVPDLALVLAAAGAVTVIFKKIKQPVVLGYIIAGFLISPNFTYLPTVVQEVDIKTLADVGMIFLMFDLGLEFSFRKLATVGGSAFTIAVTVMTAMILVGAGTGSLLGWGKMDCIFLGGMISMSSTMIILKAYEEYDLKREKFAQLVMGTLIIEDVAGIFMMIVLSTLSVSRDVSGAEMFHEIGVLILFLVIWLLAGIFIIPTVLKKISPIVNDEMLVVVSVGICLVMVVIAGRIGFSSALGAFVAGSILAGTVQAVRIENLIKPVKDLFGAIFFVSVGMMIDPKALAEHILPIAVICAVTIVGQMTFSIIGILLSGQSLRTAVRGGFSMVQIGEFSFIIASLGMNLGVISDFLYPVIVCVSAVTVFTTPLFIKSSDKVYAFLDRKIPDRVMIFLKRNTSENQSRIALDRDWFEYMKKVMLRTGICFSMLSIIYYTGIEFLDPFLRSKAASDTAADMVSVCVILLAMVPFINFMHGTNNTLFVKLWLKHRTNRLPLLTLKGVRILVSACFIALVLRKLLGVPFIISVAAAIIPIILIIRSNYITGVTTDMELRFVSNLSERILKRQKEERGVNPDYRWLNESLFVTEFRVTRTGKFRNIYDLSSERGFMVTVIRIIRKGRFINMPSQDEKIFKDDIIHMAGTSDEIDACMILLEGYDCIEYTERDDEVLKNYLYSQTFRGISEERQLICVPVRVDRLSEFGWKSIKNCGIRKKYKGTIIGIERGDLPIIKPDKETIIKRNDLLWVMGSRSMVDSMIRGDILK